MSNANLKFVSAVIDCSNELNRDTKQKLDEEESIEVHLIPKREFFKAMQYPCENIPSLVGKEGHVSVSGLAYAYALSLHMNNAMAQE